MNHRLIPDVDRQLSPEETRRYLGQPISAEERDEVLALVKWFTSRYAAPSERLAYIRRAHARWARNVGFAVTPRTTPRRPA